MKREDVENLTPVQLRRLIRKGEYVGPTFGLCKGYVQCNLVIVPKNIAYDFLLFTQRNAKACPVLEVSDVGSRKLKYLAEDIDIAKDIPEYSLYEHGILKGTYNDIEELWRDDFVSFLIGCSYSFEEDLIDAGIPMRHHEEDCVVPMYNTNIACEPAGIFHGNIVVSMRPIPYKKIPLAFSITNGMYRVHGGPIQIGNPGLIGINNLKDTVFGGGAVTIKDNEVPVFWECGVTSQAALLSSKPELVITHTAGYMLIADKKNAELK
ncbi:MAG: putative hydro-lyase [Eubacteriaceae bacterium]|nr:putative hydro-lyase [Eubacteriaceae bacterium]